MSDITSTTSNDDTPGAAPPAGVPLAVGVAAGAAGLAVWLLAAGDGAPRLASGAAVGLMAALAAWLVADAAIAWPGRRTAPVAAPADGAVTRWRAQFRKWLSYRFVAAGLAAICGAVAAYVQLTPDRVRADSALALGAPVLLGLLVAVLGAVVTLNRASAWESRLARWTAKPSGPAIPETPKGGETPKGDEKAKRDEKPEGDKAPVATSPVVPPSPPAPPPPPLVDLSPPPAPPDRTESEKKRSSQGNQVPKPDPNDGDEPPPGS